MSEMLQPAPAEVLDEFARVRERFLAEFDIDTSEASAQIDEYFDSHALYRHPAISVPHTMEAFTTAYTIATETKYPLPFVKKHYAPGHDFINQNYPGVGFSVPAYKLNFLTDTSKQNAELYGEEYAKRISSTLRAHELAHSVFHADPTILAGQSNKGLELYEEYPLSGMLHRIYSPNKRYFMQPNLAEEAFATYVAADIFKADVPDHPGIWSLYANFGPDPVFLNSHYLAHSSNYPGQPGAIDSAVAGEILESLNEVLPGMIDGMFDVARGEKDPQVLRDAIKAKVGQKLFGLIFSRHPATTWSSTYNLVNRLDT